MAFGRLEKPAGHQPMSEINVTPLVDVMLVLLVIFILAAPVMAGRLALELPRAPTPATADAATAEPLVALSLTSSGQLFWNEQPVTTDAVRERLQAAAVRNPGTEVQLRADARVPYGRVVELIGLAQTAGLSRIGFVAEAPPAGVAPGR
jgi:biopolymer transport protein TolR